MRAPRRQQRFEHLLREHQRIVLKVASMYTRQVEDRQDLVQEICIQLWRSFSSYNAQRGRFSTWMYRVALNVAISQWRKASPDVERLEPLQSHHLESLDSEPVEKDDERLRELYRFIGQLDALNRALILLYLEDRSYGEIAEILGISETNVATKISRIKQKLRSQMTATENSGA